MTDNGLCDVVCSCCGLALPQRLPQAYLQHRALAGILPLPVHLQGRARTMANRTCNSATCKHQASALRSWESEGWASVRASLRLVSARHKH